MARQLEVAGVGFSQLELAGIGRWRIDRSMGQGRLGGRVALITGAAQGFGREIAVQLAGLGCRVVLADVNLAGAQAAAEALNASHGDGWALAVAVDVASPESFDEALGAVLDQFGGVDLLVSNAGVVRAGSVTDLTPEDFDLVTRVNYRGYFVAVRALAPVMAAQHAGAAAVGVPRWFDVIEVNSKSGLTGSRRNSAYAGSKFGGIGLTQSFALELVDQGIKVNAVCPGNYLDGPLWTDPERGLLRQYLAAGKVPGATTVDDVRRHYERQVPMGRGCLPVDVVRAICYCVEQAYETGQAIPVTGGQTMLN
ncbi:MULTISPECIES: SDR family NAD(P)-dependent oxidoreductase [unclassified Luteococcus]|uniref:SDR family NAD(P)-dependent oxidoreductase n=1 Tax=unclassified Luteococcus TaxID=2639923 RepID=UPI00313C160B